MRTIEVRSWNEFREYVRQVDPHLPSYWRGQSDPRWPLASLLDRKILNLRGGWMEGASKVYPYGHRYSSGEGPTWLPEVVESLRHSYLSSFIREAQGVRGFAPAQLDEDQWWALGRHYGLVTPLLDWSESPYVAAFFALAEMWQGVRRSSPAVLNFSDRQIAIYRLEDHESLRCDELRIVRPSVEELWRMHSQKGLFTRLESQKYFELQGLLDDTGRGHLLPQYLVSGQVAFDALPDLHQHGIDFRRLFPDIAGAALQANWSADDGLRASATWIPRRKALDQP